MRSRLGRLDLILSILGLCGLVVFLGFYSSVSPTAAVSLEVSREEAESIASRMVLARGADPARFLRTSRFETSGIAFQFLERTLGLSEASHWASQEVPIWYWTFRWFRPLEKEEWRVRVNVDGTPVEVRHLLDEAAEGANLDPDSAQSLAESLLRERGWNLDEWERVEVSSERLDNRTDHTFSWERRGSSIIWREGDPQAGAGSVRLRVRIAGDEVSGYRHFLRVPEEFQREYEQTTSLGTALTVGAIVLMVVLGLMALWIAIARTRADGVRWRPALWLAGAVGGLFLAQQLTGWRLMAFVYPTSFDWTAYRVVLVAGLLISSLLFAVFMLLPTAAGESLAREVFPASLVGFLDWGRDRLARRQIALASYRGYALGFAFLGYLTVFYLLARRFAGAWLPAEGPYSQIFDYSLPFLTPLTLSLVAALTEEVIFRLFGISLIKRYLKSTVLALLIPAAIWAFAHSSYPVFPMYVRGIELTIGGVLFGIAFLRLGLLACIVAHYVVDAVLIGMPLLTSNSAYYVLSGFVVIALALLPALLALITGRRTEGEAEQARSVREV
jgi:hypothetical protein